MHILFVCPKATKCWDLVEFGTMIREMLGNTNDFNIFLFDFFKQVIFTSTATCGNDSLESLEESQL